MDPARLQPGYRLDRYELICPLAYGGMASVWLARFAGRLGFERLVVIKMILPQYSQDARFQQMFLDEARIASRIEHGNVARILDVGEHDEGYFLVMEWVDGDSLSKVMRAAEQSGEPMPTGVVLRICSDAAAGLHAAHELLDRDGTPLGVVHRDVSPQNIMVANSGATMLIDFGVAKARDRVSQETSAGQLKGKIRYMAPEQAIGHDVDRRADLWALGTILYEAFAGEPPYEGPNEVATLHRLTSGAPPAPLPDFVPPAVKSVILRALAYHPKQRYSTALEMHVALETAMLEMGEQASVAGVAHYTAQLLGERKAARRRAVDAALIAADARDSGAPAPNTSPLPAGIPVPIGQSIPPGAHSRPPAHSPSSFPSGLERPMMPSGYFPPSTSFPPYPDPVSRDSATFNAGAMEYHPTDVGHRKRRYFGAAILGLSIAAGVVGVVLIVSTTMIGPSRGTSGAARPAETGPPPPPTQAVTAPVAPPPEPTPSAAPQAITPPPSPPTPAKAAPSARPSTSPSAPSPRPSAAKPVKPGTPSTKKDYGF